MSKKVGRNSPCPCGSTFKFKKCCGNPVGHNRIKRPLVNISGFPLVHATNEALEVQRVRQQGKGNPISTFMDGNRRYITVGSATYESSYWKSFHDFLLWYIKLVLGAEWGRPELKKEFDDRHPIMKYYYYVCTYTQAVYNPSTAITSAPMTGAIFAYLNIAYNLYLLSHNVELQERLVGRLKHPEQFIGAHHELFVFASLIKAGFAIEFENEADGSISHHECTAIYKATGEKFSVEAKARVPGKKHVDIGTQLSRALKKEALYPRIIFIELSSDLHINNQDEDKELALKLHQYIHDRESKINFGGNLAPSAYVIVTNHDSIFHLDSHAYSWLTFADGFRIPDFCFKAKYGSIREAADAHARHKPIFDLVDSIKKHYQIPATFDGQMPLFAFRDIPRLVYGYRYVIPDVDGRDAVGVLYNAAVMENDKIVYGAYKLDDGRNIIARCPISDEELLEYKRNPDTFFGQWEDKPEVNSPIEFYKWIMDSYKDTPKSKLLHFLAEHPQYNELRSKSAKELLEIFAECTTYSMLNSAK